MIETASPVTLQLAMVIGAMALAAGISGWRRPQMWPEVFDELEPSPALAFAIAFVAIILGALILVLPGGWSDPLAIAVSLVGAASLADGLILLAVPRAYVRLVKPLVRFARPWAAFAMALGLIFLLAGLAGTTPA